MITKDTPTLTFHLEVVLQENVFMEVNTYPFILRYGMYSKFLIYRLGLLWNSILAAVSLTGILKSQFIHQLQDLHILLLTTMTTADNSHSKKY
jgi:hypothetical protein